jgi:hypothetical protein
MKSRALLWLGLAAGSIAPVSANQNPRRAPHSLAFPAQSQRRGDVTVRVTDAGWYRLDEIMPAAEIAPGRGGQVVFAISLAAEAPEPVVKRQQKRPPFDHRRQVSAYLVDAEGRREIGAGVSGRPGLRYWSGTSVPDLRSRTATLELEYTSPFASRSKAEGFVEDWVQFRNLPALHTPGERRELDLTQTTAHGAQIILEEAGVIRAGRPEEPRYFITGRWLPPASHPGMAVSFERYGLPREQQRHGHPAEDDQGRSLIDPRRADWVRAGSLKEPKDYNRSRFTLDLRPPAPDAKEVRLNLKVWQGAPEFRDPNAVQPFRFTLASRDWRPYPSAPAAARPPIATRSLGDDGTTLALEELEPSGEKGWAASWRGRLVVTASRALPERREWVNTRFEWRKLGEPFPGGGAFLEPHDREGKRILTHADGRPFARSEQGWEARLVFDSSQTQTPPERLALYSEWQEVEHATFDLDFEDLPVPQVGEIVTAEREAKAGRFGRFILRKVGWFDSRHPLSSGVKGIFPRANPAEGLAVVVEYVPADGTPAPVWDPSPLKNPWRFTGWKAEDSTGRRLIRGDDLRSSQHPIRDELAEPPGGTAFTVFLLPPAEGAKRFRLQLRASRAVALREAKVVFEDLPAPR